MKQIDIATFIKKSKQTDVSIFLLIKRHLNYRESTTFEKMKNKCCGRCQLRRLMPYPDGDKLQCELIGTDRYDVYAGINENCVCDNQKK